MSQDFPGLLREFAAHVGIADAEGLVASGQVVIDGIEIALLFEDEIARDNVVFYADLGAPPVDRAADVHRHLLEGNMLWAGTGGATLGVHPDTAHVYLAYRTGFEGLTGEGLATALDQFANIAKYWSDFVAGTRGGGTGAVPGAFQRA